MNTYILNLDTVGIKLYNAIVALFGLDQSVDAKTIAYIYKDIFFQLIDLLCDDLDDYCLKTVNGIDYRYYLHIGKVNDPVVRQQFNDVYRSFATELFYHVFRFLPRDGMAHEYILINVNLDTLVINQLVEKYEVAENGIIGNW